MGLDMYMYKRTNGNKEDDIEVAYFRKHSDLHGYFNKLYNERGYTGEFNCVELPLSKEDLEEVKKLSLAALINDTAVEKSSGFFWGQSNDQDWLETIEVINKILSETDFESSTIIYDSWW